MISSVSTKLGAQLHAVATVLRSLSSVNESRVHTVTSRVVQRFPPSDPVGILLRRLWSAAFERRGALAASFLAVAFFLHFFPTFCRRHRRKTFCQSYIDTERWEAKPSQRNTRPRRSPGRWRRRRQTRCVRKAPHVFLCANSFTAPRAVSCLLPLFSAGRAPRAHFPMVQ